VAVNIPTTEFSVIVFRATTKEFLELIGTVKLFQNFGCRFRWIFHKIRKIMLLLWGKGRLLRIMTRGGGWERQGLLGRRA